MKTKLSNLYLPMFLILPMSITACGGQADEQEDLVTESASLALVSEDGSADPATEEALGTAPADLEDAADESVDAATEEVPDEGFVSCDFSALRQQVIARFDENGDGTLDETERAALRNELDAHPRAQLFRHRLLGTPGRRPHYHVWSRIRWAFDVDGDGTLSAEERADLVSAMEARCTRRKEAFIAKYDTDGNGQISRDELRAALAQVRDAFQAKRAEFMAKYDTNQDGVLDSTERAQVKADLVARVQQIRQNVLATFDTNGDGTLDEAEIAALKAEIRRRIAEGVERAL